MLEDPGRGGEGGARWALWLLDYNVTKVVITRSRLVGMKFCPVLSGSRQCYKFFINYILRLHVKSFIPAGRDPSIVLPGSRFAGTKFSHVIPSAHLSGMKISIEVHFNRSKIFLLRFYDAYDANL